MIRLEPFQSITRICFSISVIVAAHCFCVSAVLAQGRIEIPEGGEFKGPTLQAVTLDSAHLELAVGHRPSRSTGLRVELEASGPNPIVHAYAHGGAGLTLAFGTAELAIDLVRKPIRENKKVVIIGGGVIGFTIAHQLREQGHRGLIEIYSAEFFPNNVSRIAGGLWSPVSFQMSTDDPKLKGQLLRTSFQKYKELSRSGWPVIPMPMFVTEEAQQKSGLEEFRAMEDVFTIQRFNRLPIKGVTEGGYGVQTFLIDTPRFMIRLMNEVRAMPGVAIHHHRFESIAEAHEAAGQEAVLFNATGIGARQLVGDHDVFPTRGDLIYIKGHQGFERPSQIMGHMAFYSESGTDYAFPRDGDLVIGGTFMEHDWSLEVRNEICAQKLASFNRFYGLTAP